MPNWNAPLAILKRAHTWSNRVMSLFKRDGRHVGWCSDTLRKLGGELGTLASSTEGEFLSMGEKLLDFHQRASEISKISRSVADLMSGEKITSVIGGFHKVAGCMERLEGDSEQRSETLQCLLDILTDLYRHLTGFHETVRRLRVLCVSMKIESARLGEREDGFNDLADEVGKLAIEIENRYSHLLARSEALSHLIRQVQIRVRDIEIGQHSQARVILDQTMSTIEAITERHALSSSGAKDISNRYDDISRSIGEIVSSMQFHDITRQCIEHAKEALEGITGLEGAKGGADKEGETSKFLKLSFSANGGRRSVGETKEFFRQIEDVCELQVAQLRRAGDTLLSAVENIIENLRRLAALVTEISQKTQEMAGAVDESGRSSLAEVEAGSSSIASARSAYSDANRELSTAMESVGGTLGEMSAYTGDIEGIGAKIKLIALNAIVKAAHIGDEGTTLGVLAEAIHNLSAETCRRTEAVSAVLRSIMLASGDEDASSRDDEMGHVAETLQTLLRTLKDMNESIVALLIRMNEEGRSLSDVILRSVDGVSVHHRVSGVIDSVVSQLNELVALSRSLSPADSQSDKAERMKTLEASYTMEGEREVHQSMVSSAGVVPEEPHLDHPNLSAENATEIVQADAKSDEETGEDLGDNVEFF